MGDIIFGNFVLGDIISGTSVLNNRISGNFFLGDIFLIMTIFLEKRISDSFVVGNVMLNLPCVGNGRQGGYRFLSENNIFSRNPRAKR